MENRTPMLILTEMFLPPNIRTTVSFGRRLLPSPTRRPDFKAHARPPVASRADGGDIEASVRQAPKRLRRVTAELTRRS